ncbi:MAG: formylglycine-generating enzyme family protein [Planctomycetes bacterium]|nr:formylglycine-generating enzyme family protein [Planctomycetota bacterium]
MRSRGNRIAFLTGAVALVVLGAAAYQCRSHLLFWWRFEPLGPNAQGYREYRHRQTGVLFVRLPGGKFWMGAQSEDPEGQNYDSQAEANEGPVHEVALSTFLIAKHEVTKRQWEAVMGTRPWAGQRDVLDDPDSPAVYVSWDDAQAFVAAVNALGQGTFRLPAEAEWEYACRAGTTTRFYWGDDPTYSQIGAYAWYGDNAYDVGERYAHVVGQKLPNAWGLYDMSGNVWEWCQDWYGVYPAGPVTDPAGPPAGAYRVGRGGSWGNIPGYCRSAVRYRSAPWIRYRYLGFRLARQ